MTALPCLLAGLLLMSSASAQTPPSPAQPDAPEANRPGVVVLIHGLGLGSWAMKRVERGLRADGHRVVNLSYDSRRVPLEELCTRWLPAELSAHHVELGADAPPLHFVTHSMGGIVLRGWLDHAGAPPALHRVVMFAPPNRGSSLVDRIGTWRLFRWTTGVNGVRLGTGADSFPNQLGAWPKHVQLGILAGDRPINPLLAHWTGGPGDGKVRVADTHLAGMTAHRVLPHSHTWIQYRRAAISQVRAFLRHGTFSG